MPLGIFGSSNKDGGPKPQPLTSGEEKPQKKDKCAAGSSGTSEKDMKGSSIKLSKKTYTVERKLAEGGFAIVYLVTDKHSRNYALKRQLIRDDPRQVEACRTERSSPGSTPPNSAQTSASSGEASTPAPAPPGHSGEKASSMEQGGGGPPASEPVSEQKQNVLSADKEKAEESGAAKEKDSTGAGSKASGATVSAEVGHSAGEQQPANGASNSVAAAAALFMFTLCALVY